MSTNQIISVILYLILAPVVGGLIDGFDRKISARMQGRKGPSVLQPFFDLKKLCQKNMLYVNTSQIILLISYAVFVVITGALFFAGFDLLLCFFALSTASVFLIMASSSTHSTYSSIGSMRELMQIMAYEPMVLITAVTFYLTTGSFRTADIVNADKPAIFMMPAVFIGFCFILTIKFRKSPFDIATSHHAHQEVIKGLTSEFCGPEYAITTMAEWYENVFLYGVVALFFIYNAKMSILVAILACIIVFFIEVLIDNTSARVKWQLMLKLAWSVTIICGGLNLLVLEIL